MFFCFNTLNNKNRSWLIASNSNLLLRGNLPRVAVVELQMEPLHVKSPSPRGGEGVLHKTQELISTIVVWGSIQEGQRTGIERTTSMTLDVRTGWDIVVREDLVISAVWEDDVAGDKFVEDQQFEANVLGDQWV